jgi:N-acetylglucosaminyl-diphospho-decaprenol L-rhamnosyltransferase
MRSDEGDWAQRLDVVVVNHNSGASLAGCVDSLNVAGVQHVVIVDNDSSDDSLARLTLPAKVRAAAPTPDPPVMVIQVAANIGYGAGANRGIAASVAEMVMVCNPDLVVHPGAPAALVAALDADPSLGIVGPLVLQPDGKRYPSARRFPSLVDAAGHGLLGFVAPDNRFSRRYRLDELDRTTQASGSSEGPALAVPSGSPVRDSQGRQAVAVDWVSGSCFAARRSMLEELGGFDESYFMYAEDVDLCSRAHQAGWGVGYLATAVVTHAQGVSTSRRPYRMLAEHHRSLMRYAVRSTRGWRRLLLPGVAAGLGTRLAIASARHAVAAKRTPGVGRVADRVGRGSARGSQSG